MRGSLVLDRRSPEQRRLLRKLLDAHNRQIDVEMQLAGLTGIDAQTVALKRRLRYRLTRVRANVTRYQNAIKRADRAGL